MFNKVRTHDKSQTTIFKTKQILEDLRKPFSKARENKNQVLEKTCSKKRATQPISIVDVNNKRWRTYYTSSSSEYHTGTLASQHNRHSSTTRLALRATQTHRTCAQAW